MLAPMIAGFATMQVLAAEFSDMALFAHPSLGGAARIAPALLIGKLFRSGRRRRGDLPEFRRPVRLLARRLAACSADNARMPRDGQRPGLPVPAGGMTLQRVPELLDFYGPDAMLLIGGNLLLARDATDRGDRRIHARRRGA